VWLTRRHSGRAFLLVPPVLLMDFWLASKRNIVALIVILVVFVLLASKGRLTRQQFRRRLAVSLVLLVGLLGVSEAFEHHYRPTVIASGRSVEIFELDFGRTAVLRLAVAGQIDSHVPRPLSYPGQSLVLYAQQATDRLTHHHPISYEDRVTSIAEQTPIHFTGGAITTSVVSEAVDNFGLFGLLIGPLLLAGIVRWSGRSRDPLMGLLIPLFGALIIATNVVAAAPIVALMVARAVWVRFSPTSASPGVKVVTMANDGAVAAKTPVT
jgi:hypothetical protein